MQRIGLLITILLALLFFYGCFKDPEYSDKDITGTWRCHEQSAQQPYRIYNVSIDRDRIDTTRYTIFNMYNTGFQFEVYATLNDTILTILGSNSFDVQISGIGRIHPNNSAISWVYNYSSSTLVDYQVEAIYYRP